MWAIAVALISVGEISIDAPEKEALKARMSIRSGELRIRSTDFIRNRETGEITADRIIDYDLSFDGEQIRTEQSAGRVASDGSFVEFAREAGLYSGGRLYYRAFDLSNPDVPLAIPVAIEGGNVRSWKHLRKYVFDVRLFGIQPVPFGVLHACRYDGFLLNRSRSETSVEVSNLNGYSVRLITARRPGGIVDRLWISPELGWNVIRSETSNDRETAQLTIDVAKYSDMWFPQKVVYEVIDNDHNIIEKNVATVLDARFNAAIANSRFTLAGLNPVEGSVVFDIDNPALALGQWDGADLVPFEKKGPVLSPPIDSKRSSAIFYVYVVNAIIGVIALVVYYRMRRTRVRK